MTASLKFVGPCVIWLTVSGFLGCAQTSLRPVTDSTKRLDFYGFSLLAPQGKHWFVKGEGKYGIAFEKMDPDKRASDPSHTFIATVMSVHSEGVKIDTPQDFKRAVDRYFQGVTAGRFRLVESHVTPYQAQGTDCVKYDIVQEERDNPYFPGVVFLITAHGFQCRHPFWPERIVHGFYSERYAQVRQSFVDDALRQEAQQFLQNVVFAPLR